MCSVKNNQTVRNDPAEAEPVPALTALLIDAVRALGSAGQPQVASRLAGRAYSTLRGDHPDQGQRINALMHRLARMTDPIKEHTMPPTGPPLDVRSEPPARRHKLIFDTYDSLSPGAGFVLVNDTTPSRSTNSSRPSTPDSSAGSTSSRVRRCGACASGVLSDVFGLIRVRRPGPAARTAARC